MSSLLSYVQSLEFLTRMSSALLHTFWQATAAALLYLLALKLIPANKPAVRHNLGMFFLFTILMAWLCTLSMSNRIVQTEQAPRPAAATQTASPDPVFRAEPAALPEFETSPTHAPVISVKPANPQTPSNSQSTAYRFLIIIWFTGVAAMLLRLTCSLTGVRRHRNQASPVSDPDLLERLNNLCSRLMVRRKIELAVSSTLNNPGVIGIVKPMILLPAAMLTTYSASDIDAIIAHELSHIRRHDYFLNLLQMIIEALFFFNPAIWWISHRIRMEREICCDAMAMQSTGQKFEYANLLLNEFSERPATLPAFGNNRKADAKERLIRLVQPNKLLNVKISAIRLVCLLTLTGLALSVLSQTSDLAVETVAKLLTPKERVEKLIEIADGNDAMGMKEYYNHNMNRIPDLSDKPKISISGRVKTMDGSPLPKRLYITYASFPNSDDMLEQNAAIMQQPEFIEVARDGSFSKSGLLTLGTQSLRIEAKGFAPLNAQFGADENMSDLELTLDPGFTGTITVLDEGGQPISKASVRLSQFNATRDGGVFLQLPSQITDQNGCTIYEHQNTDELLLTVEAAGFPKLDYFGCSFNKEGQLVVTLKKGIQIPGTVTDKATGLPIADARIMLIQREKEGCHFRAENTELTRSGNDGSFSIPNILPDETYRFSIKAPGKNTAIVHGITARNKTLNIELGPERVIRGKIIGDLSLIEDKTNGAGVPSVFYSLEETPGVNRIDPIPVTFTNGIGCFEIRNIPSHSIELSLKPGGRKLAELTLNEQTIYDLTIDLDSDQIQYGPNSRLVEVEVVTPPGLPKAEGTIQFYQKLSGSDEVSFYSVAITNGRGQATFKAPGHFTTCSASGLKGYWIKPQPDFRKPTVFLEPESKPYRYSIKAEPAGGVCGHVLNAEGKPYSGYRLSIRAPEPYTVDFWGTTVHKAYQKDFALTSLPLNKPFVLTVHNMFECAVSEPILLTEEEPIQNIVLRFKPAETIQGGVLYPDGTPARNLNVYFKAKILSGEGFTPENGPFGVPSRNGRFIYHKVSDDPRIEYTLHIEAPGDYQKIEVPVKPGSNETYTLKPKKQV